MASSPVLSNPSKAQKHLAVAELSKLHDVYGRHDYAIIGELVRPGSRVLDLGCGGGELLAWLKENKNVEARGVERSGQKVQKAIARGVSVYQGDLETAVDDYPDKVFDYVILSQTLQETRYPLKVLERMLRVGKNAIVAFPNFGHYSVRLSWLLSGRAPRTELFPYDWYDSPNIHFLTVLDFESLVEQQKWRINRRIFLSGTRQVKAFPNLLAQIAVFEVTTQA